MGAPCGAATVKAAAPATASAVDRAEAASFGYV
jgi:hypothetical protein